MEVLTRDGRLTFGFTNSRDIFVCERRPSTDAIGPVIQGVQVDVQGYRQYQARMILAYFGMVLSEESQQRLLVAINRYENVIPLSTLGEAMMWCVERVTLRPYGHTRALCLWAVSHWGYLRGRMLLAGLDPDSLELAQLLDIVYVIFLDDVPPEISRMEARKRVDKVLDDSWVDRQTWGLTPSARAAQRAMMEQVPPAPMRDPNEARRQRDATQAIRDPTDTTGGED